MANSGVDPKSNDLVHNNTGQGHYAELGDLRMYYEIHGAGKPLVLLGGGFMTVEAMSQVLGPLSQSRQIIAAELQGHGHTADIDVWPAWRRRERWGNGRSTTQPAGCDTGRHPFYRSGLYRSAASNGVAISRLVSWSDPLVV